MRARAVADGQQVDIPVLQYDRTVGTRKESGSRGWIVPVQARYQYGRKIRHAMGRRDVERKLVAKPVSHASRKAAIVHTVPVP